MNEDHHKRTEAPKDRLLAKIRAIDDEACLVIESLVDALALVIENHIAEDTDIVTARFSKNFKTRLQIHHATTREKFKKKSFEYAFQEACKAAGWHADMTLSGTFAGNDVTVKGVRYSLKTEASAKIMNNVITISKFAEAAWIRDCRTSQDFRDKCVARVETHIGHYDRILILRAFSVNNDQAVRYDLLEIPRSLFEAISNLSPEDFGPRTTKGGSSAKVTIDGKHVYSIRLDGSVEKITISSLKTSFCKQHASWTVPILIPDSNDENDEDET